MRKNELARTGWSHQRSTGAGMTESDTRTEPAGGNTVPHGLSRI